MRTIRPEVLVVDIGDPIFIAMLQAFYSRSPMPIRERLATLDAEYVLDPINYVDKNGDKANIREKLNKYYVGYGHKSIGELGAFVLFIENVSFVAAKAIQHFPLYQGQEVSTRYVDFSTQAFASLPAKEMLESLAEKQMNFYQLLNRIALEQVRKLLGKENDSASTQLQNAIKAKAFDVARAVLPVGLTTSLAWKTDFATAREHLTRLAAHPLNEVQELAYQIAEALVQRYPEAFSHKGISLAQELRANAPTSAAISWWKHRPQKFRQNSWLSRAPELKLVYADEFDERNNRYLLQGELDFGSWRDLARHRNGMTLWPFGLAEGTMSLAMLRQLYVRLVKDTKLFLNLTDYRYQQLMREVPVSKKEASSQRSISAYHTPLSQPVQVYMSMDVDQVHYLLGLRTQETVHHTLRSFLLKALEEHKQSPNSVVVTNSLRAEGLRELGLFSVPSLYTELLRSGVPLNETPPSAVPSLKRGTQTIVEKHDR